MRGSLQSFSVAMVLLVGLLAGGPASAHESLRERIEAFVRAEQQRMEVPGVAVAVVSHGRVILAKGYGFSNLEHQVPVTPDTLFQSGSLGKQFTAMAVMLQVEAGRISLSDSITKYFPDAPASWAPITIRHLLTHTSGVGDHLDALTDFRKDYTDAEFAQLIYAQPLNFPAGLRWSYSNSGYVLLGLLVNRVAGTSYVNVLGEQVFKPTRMKTARGISEADIVPNRAAGYRLLDGVVKNQDWVSPSLNTTADGSLYFSLKDLLAWDEAVDDRAILTKGSWREILSPVKLSSGAPYPYGFGWFLNERNGRPVQQHSGAWQGFKTSYYRFPADSLSIIVLLNLSEANPAAFANGIAAIVNPALAVPPLAAIPDLEPEVTARLATLLEQTRAGALDPAEFAYMPGWFFPEEAPFYQALLQRLGPSGPLVLARREVLGDDRVYTYLVQVGSTTLRYRVALIPDGRVSAFSLSPN
ncbi:serine hydrolase domain-containing protein [Pyxidicoccus xibeiensis]|uniref:serine hydrolase domain-containing protein n=1 Tax=Pyxidicoccus xibeiensis TaxID=2906759 RepID=UPI0020A71FEC|nr:serine hydrolase domain-containing protein [Pyxidicoccus xibeiensis]MCP3143848.1 beta-lactamase family protein [Pyxidicoccus xibeiensis]